MDKPKLLKLKNFCSVKSNVIKMRIPASDQEEIFAKDTSVKRLLPKLNKELLKFNKKTNNMI